MIRVAARVHPAARVERAAWLADGTLDVYVRAPASDGRANEALVALLAEALGLRPRQVRLIYGARSRNKVVELDLAGPQALSNRLAGPERGR